MKTRKKNQIASIRALTLTQLAYEVWHYHTFISNSIQQTNRYLVSCLKKSNYRQYGFNNNEIRNHVQRVNEKQTQFSSRKQTSNWHFLSDQEADTRQKKRSRSYIETENVK